MNARDNPAYVVKKKMKEKVAERGAQNDTDFAWRGNLLY